MNLQAFSHSANLSTRQQTVPRSKNLFLAALPAEEFERLKPHLEHVDLKLGDIIHRSDELIRYVYFPEHSVISIVTYLEEGTTIETGIVGREGLAGISVILSDDVSPREATVQVSDGAWRMKAQTFKTEFERGGAINRLALRFVYAFIAQISQNAACSHYHQIEARLARWLLTLQDRVESDELRITQEYISQMLGVQRPTVTNSAIRLQEQGLIRYARGRITILDRQGLENTTCECYQAIKEAYNKYLSV